MKRCWLLFAWLPLAAAAQAPETPAPVASPNPCVAIEDATERLACYDAAAGRAPAEAGAAAPVEEARPKDLRVHSRLDGPLREWRPGMRMTLQNGQVWKIAESTGGYSSSAIEYPAVTIEKSFFGSYWMAVEGLERKLKVQRVK